MPDYWTNYRETHGRILSLVNNQNADLPVPACPGWTVKDVIAHLAGVLDDYRKGNMEGAPGPEWTARQVASRRHRSISDIGAEWHLLANTSPHAFQQHGGILVADVVSHEFDIKGALGLTEGRNLPVVRSVTLVFLNGVDWLLRENGVPALRILVEDKALDVGDGEPQGTVEMGWWEAMRIASGRRSREQVRALAWTGDPETWLDYLFIFDPRDTDLVE
jgi:uncharacterized protein (TIGR03083 family)